jgi:dynein regulatory complex protein 1
VRSGKQNAAVEMRWAELLDQAMPQELQKEIEQQKGACVDIIRSKDDLIRDFQQQLKSKDEEYVKALKQQSDDVEDMLSKMHNEFKDLQEEYEVELESIEGAFMAERDELLASNKGEIDGLFEKRRAMELAYMDAKQKREEQYQRELDELVVKDAEEYNKLKIRLETDIQVLEQQLEEMRATYQLNTEKLEYNFRVLSERDTENTSTLQKQKKKLTKIKDDLSRVVLKYHEFDARDKKKNEELSEDYRRITKQ